MRIVAIVLITALLAGTIGCASMSNTQKGTAVGAGAGAGVGAMIGKHTGNTAVGALIGAAIGGAAGAYIGHQMDEQAAEIERDLEGATVERVGEGIKITFDSGILFAVNKTDIQPVAAENLSNLAEILQKYPDTDILVYGHTDATGSEEYNLQLSRNRAQAVANYLAGKAVDARRFTIMGFGESQPVADNETEMGRQANRRVELAIMANDELKKAAEAKAG